MNPLRRSPDGNLTLTGQLNFHLPERPSRNRPTHSFRQRINAMMLFHSHSIFVTRKTPRGGRPCHPSRPSGTPRLLNLVWQCKNTN
jgi:hypothetical protein